MRVCSGCGVARGSIHIFCNRCGMRLPPVNKPVDQDELDDLCNDLGHLCQLAFKGGYCPVCGKSVVELTRHIKLKSAC